MFVGGGGGGGMGVAHAVGKRANQWRERTKSAGKPPRAPHDRVKKEKQQECK